MKLENKSAFEYLTGSGAEKASHGERGRTLIVEIMWPFVNEKSIQQSALEVLAGLCLGTEKQQQRAQTCMHTHIHTLEHTALPPCT